MAVGPDDALPYTTWSDYGGSADSMQYSALAQINRANVKQLQSAWFYPVPGDPDRLPFNPLVVDEVMYVAGTTQAVVALDAATGKELWTSTEKATERGLTYYKRPDNIYPVSWIRNYGKGHVFYSSLGHMPETFMTPEIVGHLFAGFQFMLGDLEADATPNPRRD